MSEMDEQKLDILDQAIARLIEGEEVASIVSEFPAHTDEIGKIRQTQKLLLACKSEKPDEAGLQKVLASLRLQGVTKAPEQPFSLVSFVMTYRTALIMPLLFIVLVASGAVLLPLVSKKEETNKQDTTTSASLSSGSNMKVESMDARQETTNPIMMKAFSVAPTAPQASPLPQDQELVAIFGNELNGDMTAVSADQEKSMSAGDDTSTSDRYNSIYNENDF